MIQYSGMEMKVSRGCGVLDTPQEPVIGLAGGETRWRGMTTVVDGRSDYRTLTAPGNGSL
jgi:hypothetical protein